MGSMSRSPRRSSEQVSAELSADEREFIRQTLGQWEGPAGKMPFPFQMLGLASWDEFGDLVLRLRDAVAAGAALDDLDWARVLVLTEITWASNLIGSGLDFPITTRFSDEEALQLLRGLQRKSGSYRLAVLLFPTGGRPRPPTG